MLRLSTHQVGKVFEVSAFLNGVFPHPIGIGVSEVAPFLSADLMPDELEALTPRAVERRRAEFAAGRRAAHLALAHIGCKGTSVPRGEDGRPLWPAGVAGAITHTAATAIAVVGRSNDYRGIGIDLEIIDDTLIGRAGALVCHPEELAWSDGDARRRVMLFSAKESVFKALYPLGGIRFGYLDAVLEWDAGLPGFRASLLAAVAPGFSAGSVLQVYAQPIADSVLTATWVGVASTRNEHEA
jgi:4'-phosphopantetheinyl transferase EntD